jgi:ribonuclease P/MRP protein subunit RPP40
MHFGKNNQNHEYKLNDYTLEKTQLEKDLGITITNDLNWKPHINKANRQLGLIKNSFKYLNETSGKLLYKALVRPHLEYGAVIWSPFRKGEIEKIERVQHRAIKLENLRGLTYEERINVLNIPTLENRRKRGDLIQMFKISKGYDKINFHNPIRHFSSNLRGHNMRIRREILNKGSKNDTIRHNFFTNRISQDWNTLTQETLNSETINTFKNQIDSIFKF